MIFLNCSELSSLRSFENELNVAKVHKAVFAPNFPLRAENLRRWEVGQSVPDQHAKQIILAATQRTGSTFVMELIYSHPGIFTIFEPLTNEPPPDHRIQQLSGQMQCKFGRSYLWKRCKHQQYFEDLNDRWWNLCNKLIEEAKLCCDKEMVDRMCQKYPIRLAKVVRMPMNQMAELLEDPTIGTTVQIVKLVRDPRSTMSSRSELSWCKGNCQNFETYCHDLDVDIDHVLELKKKYPGL